MAEDDARWDEQARDETPTERLDRNWNDLLQELRVIQTGVQLLTGVLLTVPFQQRFTQIGEGQKVVYLVTVGCSVIATILLQAPVSLHRVLFRQHQRRATVQVAHRLAIAGQVFLGLAVTGVVTLVFDVVLGNAAAVIGAALTLGLVTVFWIVIPFGERTDAERRAP